MTCPSDTSPTLGSIDDPAVRLATIRDRIAAVPAEEKGYAFAYRDDGAFLLGMIDALTASTDTDTATPAEGPAVTPIDWLARAREAAPKLVDLVATVVEAPNVVNDGAHYHCRNTTGALPDPMDVEIFLECGPAAMVDLIKERAAVLAALEATGLPAAPASSPDIPAAIRLLASQRNAMRRQRNAVQKRPTDPFAMARPGTSAHASLLAAGWAATDTVDGWLHMEPGAGGER